MLELDDGTRIAYRDLRRFGTWLLLEPDEAEAHLARRLGPEPLGRGFTAAYLARAARRPEGAREGGDPRPADRRRPREHLRGRGALARAASIRCGRPASSPPDEVAALREGIRQALRLGIRRQGADLGDGAYAGGRMQRRVPRLRPRGRAVRPLRHADREDARRRPRHVVLPGVPAPASLERVTNPSIEGLQARPLLR